MANKHAIDAQRAPVHSSSCGALLRLCEAICDYADCLCGLTSPWPSRALAHDDIKLYRWRRFSSAGILGFRATVTPRLSGSITLSRWNHRFSISVEPMSCRKKVTFCFRPALVNNCGSIRTIRFFHTCVNFYSRRCHTNATVGPVGPAGRREHGACEKLYSGNGQFYTDFG